MNRLLDASLWVFVLVGVSFLGGEVVKWTRASAALQRELHAAAHVEEIARDIRSLRRRPALLAERSTPSERFVGMASEAASQSAIGSAAIKSVEAEQETTGSGLYSGTGAAIRRQSVRVAIDSMQLPDLGRFLERWTDLHPSWIPSRIDLSPAQINLKSDASGTDGPPRWNVRMAFTCVYLPEESR